MNDTTENMGDQAIPTDINEPCVLRVRVKGEDVSFHNTPRKIFDKLAKLGEVVSYRGVTWVDIGQVCFFLLEQEED